MYDSLPIEHEMNCVNSSKGTQAAMRIAGIEVETVHAHALKAFGRNSYIDVFDFQSLRIFIRMPIIVILIQHGTSEFNNSFIHRRSLHLLSNNTQLLLK